MKKQTQIFRGRPFVKLLIPFCLGVFIKYHFDFPALSFKLIFSGSLLFLVLLIIINGKISFSRRWLYGLVIYLLFFVFGVLRVNEKEDYCFAEKNKTILYSIVKEMPCEKENSYSVILRTKAKYGVDGFCKVNAHMMAYFQKDSLVKELETGDRILVRANVNKIKNRGNPKEFDYKEYMKRKGVLYWAYIGSGQWKLVKKAGIAGRMKGFPYRIRKKLLCILTNYLKKQEVLHVVSAMTLGYREALSDTTRDAFSDSGAMHILAVSGLHVGFIYLILGYLFFFLDRDQKTKKVKVLIIILCLWFYALLTGLSASVVRATTLFSFIAVGKAFKRSVDTYNTLAVSAFVILFFDPLLLMEVGFQLSFAAVFSIILFYPVIYKYVSSKYWLPDKIGQMTALSIAAQIGVIPFILYYFHKFSVLFLLTNIMVVPLASFILSLGFLTLSFSFYEVVADFFAKVLSFITYSLISVVKWIDGVPFSTLKDIHFNEIHLILVLLFISSLTLTYFYKNYKYIISTMMILIFLQGYLIYDQYKKNNYSSFFVYNIRDTSLFEFISGKKSVVLCNQLPDCHRKSVLMTLKNNGVAKGVKKYDWFYFNMLDGSIKKDFIYISELTSNSLIVQFKDKKILFVHGDETLDKIKNTISIDYVVISNNANVNLNCLENEVEKVIFDASNKNWFIDKMKDIYKKSVHDYYVVNQDGAFVL